MQVRIPSINFDPVRQQHRPLYRHVRLTVEQKNRFGYVNGTHGRSGRQMDIWSAVFSRRVEGRRGTP